MSTSPSTRPDTWSPAPRPGAGERVVIGVSGGVDSSVAAKLLQDRGCEVLAVTTKNFCLDDAPFDLGDTSGSCCSEEATVRAAELCDQLDVRHAVLDVTDLFYQQVISDYVDEYHAGRTPSPCVRCNQSVRFPQLLRFADQVGAPWVATGHYARRVVWGDRVYAARGQDPGKDQSYYLSRVGSEMLTRVDFPLGELTKPQVRDLATHDHLPAAGTPDSQELCFVPDGRRERVLAAGAVPGEIVDRTGRVVGEHSGIGYFTVGQRRGLGLGGQELPRFVVELDAGTNRVVVGDERELHRLEVVAEACFLHDPRVGAPGLVARTRAQHPGIEVASLHRSGPDMRLTFAPPGDRAPAPGQALVLYRDDVVVGGGRIVASHGEATG